MMNVPKDALFFASPPRCSLILITALSPACVPPPAASPVNRALGRASPWFCTSRPETHDLTMQLMFATRGERVHLQVDSNMLVWHRHTGADPYGAARSGHDGSSLGFKVRTERT